MKTWNMCIDTGGTFTDCLAVDPNGVWHRTKVLSNSSLRGNINKVFSNNEIAISQDWNAPDDFVKGFNFCLLNHNHRKVHVVKYDAGASRIKLSSSIEIDSIKGSPFEVRSEEEPPLLAARLITKTSPNDILPPINLRLATTRGTNALLEKNGGATALMITKGFKDLLKIGTQQRSDLFNLNITKPEQLYNVVVEVPERIDFAGEVIRSLKFESLKKPVKNLKERGIRSIAVTLMNSYNNATHEKQLRAWLKERGMEYISLSSELSRFMKILPRAQTTVVNAYLDPIIQEYINSVQSSVPEGNLFVMTSAGGLVKSDSFTPKDSLLSGPAGGVVGASAIGREADFSKVISFDMGGTSTDVARYDNDYEYVFEHKVGRAHLVAPALSIETVAAGGGSICSFDGYRLSVGPNSAGAYPGPACYGAGGPLTVTDVNLLSRRLVPQNFGIPISLEAAEERLAKIVEEVSRKEDKDIKRDTILEGFLNIANERMADAIRKISLRKGYDPAEYGLVSFGGAGGQHCCAIADQLGIENIIIPLDAGILSAYGLSHAVVEQFAEEQILSPVGEIKSRMGSIIDELGDRAKNKLVNQGLPSDDITVRRRIVHMRVEGQESTLEVEYVPGKNDGLLAEFKELYEKRYGHWIENMSVEVESIRVIASTTVSKSKKNHDKHANAVTTSQTKKIWFQNEWIKTPVYKRSALKHGHTIQGPVLLLDPYSTVFVEPGWTLNVKRNRSLVLSKSNAIISQNKDIRPKALKLELFTNRFTSIAEEMGEMLQRTSLSVNVKERLDFSCALLNTNGELVVNAPHIPVHLGALGVCVRSLIEHIQMNPGDVIVTNHPAFGGAHLPDITVVTPIFAGNKKLVGYAASRAHHSEIGGTRPGSMPPNATTLEEEGVTIAPMRLVRKGISQWDKIRKVLEGGRYPSRNVEENIADLRAAVAANNRGMDSLKTLVDLYGLKNVTYYMDELRIHASSMAKKMIGEISNGTYQSEEFLDDNTSIYANIIIKDQSMEIDFNGTGDVHPNNLNATPAIVNSVVMYVLRILIANPIPLNEGLLEPVKITIPRCLLNPSFKNNPANCPAVVGGNVEISQRLVDTLLKPFERAACSQGTMNNVLFGNDSFGYYETVGGGTGAGPDFDGCDAVHQHMTNTRGTDPEIFEYRYPVRLDSYRIRKGSGGKGKHQGGDGIIREMTFLEPVSLSVLTQHRTCGPYGLRGGEDGQAGAQWVIRNKGKKITLCSVDGLDLKAGDHFILHTPGGGGFGKDT